MVGTTIAAAQEIMSDSRRWNLILKDQHGNKLESANGDIISMSHTIETTNSTLTIGDIFTQNINVELRRGIDNDGTVFDYDLNTAISIAYGLRDAPGIIRMGKFRVKTVEKAKDRIKLNLKDYFENELSNTYTPSSSLPDPAPLLDVMQDICTQLMPVHLYEPLYILDDDGSETEYTEAYDESWERLYVRTNAPTDSDGDPIELTLSVVENVLGGKKVSEALSICAGLIGCSLVKGRDNSLTCVWPSVIPYTVGVDRAADPDFIGDEKAVVGIVCKRSSDDENPYGVWVNDEHGEPMEGIVIEFENCLMTRSCFDSATEDYLRWYWYVRPATINHILGDPRLDPMDIIAYESMYETDDNGLRAFGMPLMSLSYSFDGGLRCTLRSSVKYGKHEDYEEENNG